ATGVGDEEFISLEGRQAGVYFLRVYGYGNAANPDYSLTINAPTGAASTDDRFEPNDTWQTANNLGTLTAETEYGDLVILSQDQDWFQFTLSSNATTGSFVAIGFDHRLGDLDLGLFDAQGNELDHSLGVGNVEQIQLGGLSAGTYLVRVNGYNGASNPEYSLLINPTGTVSVTGDIYENNDTRETATDLRALNAGETMLEDLSVEAGDMDWYRFELTGRGTAESEITVSFAHELGDVDIRLTDANGHVLAASSGTSDEERVSLQGLAAGTYFLQVAGYGGAANPDYLITFHAPESQELTDDRYEDNDTQATASNLGTLTADGFSATDLVVRSGDADWYAFTLSAAGGTDSYVRIDFENDLGDLDMALVDAQGTVVARSTGVQDHELIRMNGLAAGTYALQVYGFAGASNIYELSLQSTQGTVAADDYEDDDTMATATVFRAVEDRTYTVEDRTVEAGDVDWFRIDTAGPGRDGDEVQVLFSHALGDVDAELVDGAGNVLRVGHSTSDNETLNLAGLTAGSYYLRVHGYSGSSNPDYSVVVVAPDPDAGVGSGTVGHDRFEDNDSRETATSLGTVVGSVAYEDLTITADDDDWYSFTLEGSSNLGSSVELAFNHARGDLDMTLYDAQGQQVGGSYGVGNSETV
ncbi:MAG: PPC domain-containing protein, partial [Magnetococcus sp. WYHC-3]